MNVLLINGSPHEKGCTYTALSLIAGELNKAGILDKYNVKVIGLQVDAIERGEDRPCSAPHTN